MMFYFQRCLIRFAGKFPGFGHSASCVYIMSVNNKGSSSYFVKSSTEAKHGNAKSADSMLALLKVLTTYTMNINSQKREKESL